MKASYKGLSIHLTTGRMRMMTRAMPVTIPMIPAMIDYNPLLLSPYHCECV